MALNSTVIKSNAVLSSLSDDQVAAIVVLSSNDEQTQIGTKIGELHGRYDTDILTVSGVQKNQGEKSYDYVKRVLGEYKTKLQGLADAETTIHTLKLEKTELAKKLENNAGDAVIKQQLADANSRLAQLQTAYDADKTKFETTKTELVTEMHKSKVESQLDAAISGLKFKNTIPDSVKNILISNAKTQLFNTTVPEFTEVGGAKVLIFRDKNGAIMNNPNNMLNPFTAEELIKTSLNDVLDTTKQSGAGSKTVKTDGTTLVDLSSAKSQIVADEIIQRHLLSLGMLKTSPDFALEQNKLRKENAVEKLPLR